MNLEFIKPQNLGSLLMKSSQSNFNLRSPGSYLVRSYLITTVRYTNKTPEISATLMIISSIIIFIMRHIQTVLDSHSSSAPHFGQCPSQLLSLAHSTLIFVPHSQVCNLKRDLFHNNCRAKNGCLKSLMWSLSSPLESCL